MRSQRPVLAAALLAVLAATTAGAQVVDPSHARPDRGLVHGGDLDCRQCHACERPTEADPCFRTCPRHANNFRGDHDADEGPDVVIIDQLADLYEPVVFAHGLHARMSNMTGGCENCHHYSEDTGEVPPCRQCHDAQRNVVNLRQPALKGAYHRQCMNCHRDWSHENACGFCHAESAEELAAAAPDSTDIVGIRHPRIAATETYVYETDHEAGPLVTFHHEDHVERFGQACVACHRGDSCNRCHDGGAAARPVRKLDHLTSCISCHRERDCGFCHADETQPRFEHARSTGFALAPYHVDQTCQTCHNEPDRFRTPSAACGDCHIHWEVGRFDHAVTGLALDEGHGEFECEYCHLDRDFAARPSCTECHDDDLLADGELPGIRTD